MTILVTGGQGFIGSNFVRWMIEEAGANVDDIVVVDALKYGSNENNLKDLDCTVVKGDICDYVSTDYVFPGDNGMYKEEDEPNPINYYGYTKLLGEKYCECIARPCVIYGAKPASGTINFALWIINKVRNGEDVKIVTDQFITPTLNTSLAKMLLEITERRLKGIFHTAGKEKVSRYEFALRIADKFELDKDLIKSSRMEELNWLAKRPKDSSLDSSKALRYLKEKPFGLDMALEILEDELKNKG